MENNLSFGLPLDKGNLKISFNFS